MSTSTSISIYNPTPADVRLMHMDPECMLIQLGDLRLVGTPTDVIETLREAFNLATEAISGATAAQPVTT